MSVYTVPREVFAGLMPVSRKIFSRRTFLKRFTKRNADQIHNLYKKDWKALSKRPAPFDESFSLKTVEYLIDIINKDIRAGRRLDLGIFCQRTEKIIGEIALHSVEFGVYRSCGLSYWLSDEYSGKGYMTEAVATIISFAFEEALLHRVWLETATDNHASIAIAKKLKMRKEGIKKNSIFQDGKWQSVIHFAILEEEYDALADEWISKGYLGS